MRGRPNTHRTMGKGVCTTESSLAGEQSGMAVEGGAWEAVHGGTGQCSDVNYEC